ncbi:MAG: DUF2029 domain-containing protein [Chloroflexi bacterium]|nr:DUF2029 domain-containing protein [Chloroflexota bacterium]
MAETNKLRRFRNRSPLFWQNLGLAALVSLYAVLTLLPFFSNQTLSALGSDYRAFWSAGYIANHWGYPEIYKMQRLSEVQRSITPQADPSDFYPIPAPYLPVFLVPFQVFALFPAAISFWIWEICNVAGLILYLRFFIRRYSPSANIKRLVLTSMLLMPVFNNLWWGQPGLWLMICAGEFFFNMQRQRFLEAGLWLGGFMFKPQLLMLILPALLLQRAGKTILGFAVSFGLAGAASLALLGVTGLQNYLSLMSLWGKANSDLQAINPFLMINWRMLGLHLGSFLTPAVGWIVGVAGTIVTTLVGLWRWRKPANTSEGRFALAVFGLMVATCAAAWHSHQHSLMIAIPTLLYLQIHNRFPLTMQNLWLFILPASWVLSIVTGALMSYGILPQFNAVGAFITGTTGLALSLYSLAWAYGRNDEDDW